MDFREVLNCDLMDVERIAVASFDDYSRDDFLKMSQDKNYKFIVSCIGEKIVGFLIFLNIDEKVEIIKIATDPMLRKQGIATGLMNYIQDFVVKNGRRGVILEVNEKNEPARALYQKFGFREIYVRKKYYHNTDDAIIMEWNAL